MKIQAATEAISADKIDKAVATVLKGGRSLQKFTKLASRKSIMTLAQPGMYQYPIIMSNDIETEYAMTIAKAYQLTFASSVATAFSLNPIMDRSETPQISDYVQKFHQNDPGLMGINTYGAAKAMGLESDASIPEGAELAVESAKIAPISPMDALVLNASADDNLEEFLVMESLNDSYKPYARTERIINDKLSMMQTAQEAKGNDKNKGKLNQMGGRDSINGGSTATGITGPVPKTQYSVIRNNQLEAMEPTMVNVTIVAHGGKDASGSGEQSAHNVTLGVKAMPRLIESNLMVASMVEACQNSNAIFKFLRWTKGEQKTLDIILGISDSKKKALKQNAKMEVRFLEQAKKRKKLNGIGKFMKNEVLPTTSIVLTSFEAEKIKEISGVDLSDIKMAIKLMNKYYLLSIGIYDTEQHTLKVLFDCDTDWGYTTINALRQKSDKINDVMVQNEILSMFGRK